MKLILHIGTHKTGSTSIQQFFWENRVTLETYGVLYPSAGVDYFAHQNIAYQFTKDPRFEARFGCWEDLLSEFLGSHCEICVVSSENFEFLSSESIQALAASLNVWDVQLNVVGYVRDQASFLESEYSQRVKHGFYTGTFSEFLAEEMPKDRYDYAKYFSKWLDAAGSSLKLRVFDKANLEGGGIVTDFVSAISSEHELYALASNVGSDSKNSKPSNVVIEAIRNLAICYVDKLHMDRYEFSEKIAQPILKADLSSCRFSSEISLLTPPIKNEVLKYFGDANESFFSGFDFDCSNAFIIDDQSRSASYSVVKPPAAQSLLVEDFLKVLVAAGWGPGAGSAD